MTDLWDGATIPVLGVTGEPYSGKTLFVSSIDPKRTLMIDCEKSSETYSIPFAERHDLFEAGVLAPREQFLWFTDILKGIKPGQYSVVAVDPISDIEDGLADYVASRFKDYGFKSQQAFKSTGGIFWKQVLEFWKSFLGQLAGKCETLAFTTHLKGVWKGGKPTGRKEPAGKSTLIKLASLYLHLKRPPNSKDKPPEADVIKSRLALMKFDDAGDMQPVPILPDHLPKATPAAIREYVANPIGKKKTLSKGERYTPETLTDDERLQIQKEIADAELATEELKTQRYGSMAEAAAAQKKVREQENRNGHGNGKAVAPEPAGTGGSLPPVPVRVATDQRGSATVADPVQPAAGKPATAPTADAGTNGLTTEQFFHPDNYLRGTPDASLPVGADMAETIEEQRKLLRISDAAWSDVLAKRNVKYTADLKQTEAAELYRKLWGKLTTADLQREMGKRLAQPT